MADFAQAKAALRQRNSDADASYAEWLQSREKLRTIERQQKQVERTARGQRDPALRQIERERKEAAASERASRAALVEANAALAAATIDFSVFSDPQDGIAVFDDTIPIALFPLRMETRYRTVRRGRRTRRLLCVRVYPDDILIDSFQPEISQAERDNLRIYWTLIWRAGESEAARRAAWLALARAHGAGRAHWLTTQFFPLNPLEKPVPVTGQYVLIVLPPAPLDDAEKKAISAFWGEIWSSKGAKRDAAFDALVNAVGADRATEIETHLVPANLNDPDAPSKRVVPPLVAFLDLPDDNALPVSVEDWTRGARSWMLPERLVLIGFQNGAETLRQVGAAIPPTLQVGPDPAADPSEQLQVDGDGIKIPEAMRWMTEFPAAVANGMGFEVDLDALNIAPEFDRLFVVGLRLASDAEEGAEELGRLIAHHQATRQGFSLLPQGQATNNTDGEKAGYSWWEDNEVAYDHFMNSAGNADPGNWEARRDGAWLAGMLGIDPAILRNSPGYFGTDQVEARAMNIALWPATLGYYLEQMMEPVFSDATVARTRDFFCRHVLANSTMPLVRVGKQPYGIVQATAWSRLGWWRRGKDAVGYAFGRPTAHEEFLENLYQLTQRGAELWHELANDVEHVGNGTADPQKTLLRILELHPASVEFYQRYSQSFTQYYNIGGIEGDLVSAPMTAAMRRYVDTALTVLGELGWQPEPGTPLPEILEKIFLKDPVLLKGDLVAALSSDSELLPIQRADGLNYIAWLKAAAETSHDMLRKQEGFDKGPPTALLYLMLRHALDLGFDDARLNLELELFQWDNATYRAARREPKFLGIATEGGSTSRWKKLYEPAPGITGDAAVRLGDHIPKLVGVRSLLLDRQIKALERLKGASTGALERAFVGHLDCLSYRLDAWRLGLHSAQLSAMRSESDKGFARQGIYIGAYGWVEKLAPREGQLQAVDLSPELAAIFDEAGAAPLQRDSANFGHIHAPSLDQAVTAAVLRNGHLANATPSEPGLLAVDLSSERVRLAQQVIEGMQNGQSLGALLGYKLERGLHDAPEMFLDALIYDLRRAFPLVGNRNRLTREAALERITQVEARNVMDGEAFAEHIAKTGATTYPYGISTLPPLSDFVRAGSPNAATIGAYIDSQVAMMRSIGDAVADLAVAEGVYQMVRGNHDRAAGSLDAFSKGLHPPEVEVAMTPRSGRTLTHRLGLHLPGGVASGVGSPRTQGEPALAAWIETQMPGASSVFARVNWSDGSGATGTLTPSMADLGLSAIDLFYLVDSGGASSMAVFDELLIDYAEKQAAPRHDTRYELVYMPDAAAGLTLFELAPLVRALRAVVLGARPLRPSDIAVQADASAVDDSQMLSRPDKAQNVRNLLNDQMAPIDAAIATLDAAVGGAVDPAVARSNARDNIDAWFGLYADTVRLVVPFGLQAGGLTSALERRRGIFEAMLAKLDAIKVRWERKLVAHETAMAEYTALPTGADDAKRTELLIRAGREISTKVIAPLPANIAGLETEIAAQRTIFDSAQAALAAVIGGADNLGGLQSTIEAFEAEYQKVDLTPFDFADTLESIRALASELLARLGAVKSDVTARIAKADAALAKLAGLAGDGAHDAVVDAARSILGEAFVLLPEFTLSVPRLAEWSNSWADRDAIIDHLKNGVRGTPFPLDDWLHGVGRVRPRPRQWEMASLLGPALGVAAELQLTALQFPYKPNDVWLGGAFPAQMRDGSPFVFDSNRLLYTAHFSPDGEIDASDPGKRYTGLLIDEWTEVIPGTSETTGLAFHYDRPSTEAPQAILLVTPPQHRGSWHWDDVIDAMHETLDMARLRAVDPVLLDTRSALGPLLPATLSAVTMLPITAMLNFAVNNNIHLALAEVNR